MEAYNYSTTSKFLAYISKVESGQLRVDVLELKKFAKIYGKDTNYFLK